MAGSTTARARGAAEPGCGVGSLIAALEEDIVLGLLAPGVRLVEDELMQRFGAKRHVVREALAQLQAAGLVEKRRHVGALVRSFIAQEVEQLYEMRALLEAEAMRRMPLPLAPAALAQLKALQALHDQATEVSDARAIFHANEAFHHALFSCCGNPYLAQAIEDFARRTHAIRFGTLLSRSRQLQSRQEHHALLAALAGGERERLVELTMAHLVPPRDHYLHTRQTLTPPLR